MSEYQYYEFVALDRPLTATQMAELRSISTRATITPAGFVNEYHWGDLKGDPRRMLEKYFDAFLYTANWGTRQVMFRLPKKLIDLGTVHQYCDSEVAQAWVKGAHIVIDLTRSSDYLDDEFWEDDDFGQEALAAVAPVRAELIGGDQRLLYLAWLLSVDLGVLDDDELEPPVPANLGSLSGSLAALVEFLGIDRCLVVAASEASRRVSADDDLAGLDSWIAALPVATKNQMLLSVARGDDPFLGQQLRRRFLKSKESAEHPDSAAEARTVGDLLYRAAQLRVEGQQRAAEDARVAEAQRQAAEDARREERLDALALEEPEAWNRVEELVADARRQRYDDAVALLIDLRDLGEKEGHGEEFVARLELIRERYATRSALLRRMDAVGL